MERSYGREDDVGPFFVWWLEGRYKENMLGIFFLWERV
jgi:hypothetical protein